jgi:hypothetical protein
VGLQIIGPMPSATCWDREFADSPLEESGFDQSRNINGIDWLTGLTADIDTKGVSGALANLRRAPHPPPKKKKKPPALPGAEGHRLVQRKRISNTVKKLTKQAHSSFGIHTTDFSEGYFSPVGGARAKLNSACRISQLRGCGGKRSLAPDDLEFVRKIIRLWQRGPHRLCQFALGYTLENLTRHPFEEALDRFLITDEEEGEK